MADARPNRLPARLGAYDGTFDPQGQWEGVWVDGFGGFLKVPDVGSGALVFDLEVARGPTRHTGK